MSSPLHFVDSQDEEEMQLEPVVSPTRPPTSIDSLPGIAGSIKGVRLSTHLGKAAAFRVSPASAGRGVKTTPKARLRHDDSQIQFAAIESSPLQPEPVDSQYLTDRQKEVKERQGREAVAMFPEIRSSPRSTSRPIDYVLPKFVFKSAPSPGTKSAIIEDASPTYLADALMNEFLGSSPTPSSKRSSDRRSDDDPPSSPPLVSTQFPINQSADAPLANENHAPVQETANIEESSGNHFADKDLPIMEGYSSNGESISAIDDDPRLVNNQEDTSNMEAPQELVGAHSVSDFDIYVDAPSVPSLNKLPTEHGGIQPINVANSFQSQGSLHSSVEDEQITAQLILEMERASSQQSAKQEERAQSARGATKKRKRTADLSILMNKKKCTPASLGSQGAADVPRTGETVADCVMIDVREVDRSCPVLPQQIKRELSASPSILTSTHATETTAIVEKPPVDYPMNSEANQLLDQEIDTSTTAKKAVGRPRGSRNSQVKREEAEDEQTSALRKSTRVSERLNGSTTSSPHVSAPASQESTKGGQWFALGKTPRRGMFRWLQRSSAESEDVGTSRSTAPSSREKITEGISEHSMVQDSQGDDVSPADHHLEQQSASYDEGPKSIAKQREGEVQSEGSGVVEREEEAAATAQGVLEKLQSVLDNIKRVAFGAEEERAAVGMLFECVKEVHEAGRRHTSM